MRGSETSWQIVPALAILPGRALGSSAARLVSSAACTLSRLRLVLRVQGGGALPARVCGSVRVPCWGARQALADCALPQESPAPLSKTLLCRKTTGPHDSGALEGGTHGWCSCWVLPLDQTLPSLRPRGAGLQEGCCTHRQQVRIPGREMGGHGEGKGVPNAPRAFRSGRSVFPTRQTAHEEQRPHGEGGWNLEHGVRAQPRASQRRARPRPQPQTGTRRRREAGAAGATAQAGAPSFRGEGGTWPPPGPALPPGAPREAERTV